MTAFPLWERSNNFCLIAVAAPISTPQVGWEKIANLGLLAKDLPRINFCKFPPDNWLAKGFVSGHLTSLFLTIFLLSSKLFWGLFNRLVIQLLLLLYLKKQQQWIDLKHFF